MDKKSQPLIFVRYFTTFDIATHSCPKFNTDSQDPYQLKSPVLPFDVQMCNSPGASPTDSD